LSEIDEWLKKNAPAIADSLRPEAGPKELESLKRSLGAHASHSGTSSAVPPLMEEPGSDNVGFAFFSAEDIEGTHAAMQQQETMGMHKKTAFTNDDGCVQPAFWREGWVPFAFRARSDNLCLDFEPQPKE